MVFKGIKQIIFDNIEMQLNKNKINAIWYDSKNWGDALNPILIQYLSGKKPFRIEPYILNPKNEPIYTVIGSILGFQNPRILKNTIIWGTGFINKSQRFHKSPKQICAVRGPLTRNIILKSGLKCPAIYGDPALLYPRIYTPNMEKRYKLGIIPHYIDKGNKFLTKFKNDPEIIIIDIESSINSVVDQICSCKYIASSSLHGIIAADAYGIPSIRIKFSDKIIGDGFKFRDYFGSVRRSEVEPLIISENVNVDTIYDNFLKYKIDIDLMELLNSCPFYNQQ